MSEAPASFVKNAVKNIIPKEVIEMAEKEHEQKKQEKCDHCREIKEIAIDASYIGGKTCHDCLKKMCVKAGVSTGVCGFTAASQ